MLLQTRFVTDGLEPSVLPSKSSTEPERFDLERGLVGGDIFLMAVRTVCCTFLLTPGDEFDFPASASSFPSLLGLTFGWLALRVGTWAGGLLDITGFSGFAGLLSTAGGGRAGGGRGGAGRAGGGRAGGGRAGTSSSASTSAMELTELFDEE